MILRIPGKGGGGGDAYNEHKNSPSRAEATHILLLLRVHGLLLAQLACLKQSGRDDGIAGARPMPAITTLDCCTTGAPLMSSQRSEQAQVIIKCRC